MVKLHALPTPVDLLDPKPKKEQELVSRIKTTILDLLTSFCMKDNPGPGVALGGGKKGRKAWEIDEEATCELRYFCNVWLEIVCNLGNKTPV